MLMMITTTDGAQEPFDPERVRATIVRHFEARGITRYPANMVTQRVYDLLCNLDYPTTVDVQDAIEYALLCYGEVELVHSLIRTRIMRELGLECEQAL